MLIFFIYGLLRSSWFIFKHSSLADDNRFFQEIATASKILKCTQLHSSKATTLLGFIVNKLDRYRYF